MVKAVVRTDHSTGKKNGTEYSYCHGTCVALSEVSESAPSKKQVYGVEALCSGSADLRYYAYYYLSLFGLNFIHVRA